ncbi:MAG: hypothetical protein KUG62_03645 [Rhodobacteraceae bacterium]|nr:hypothetical protein [Paracoccaceae bacterium]
MKKFHKSWPVIRGKDVWFLSGKGHPLADAAPDHTMARRNLAPQQISERLADGVVAV